MKKIKTILVDDEPLDIRGLEIRLRDYDDVEIVARCGNGRDAIKAVKTLRPNLVFLDIQMPGYDGFGVIKALVGQELPLIVFVTAFDEYALEAFESHAIDYLLKPVDPERLEAALTRVRGHLAQYSAIQQNARIIKMIRNMGDEDFLAEIMAAEEANKDGAFESRINIRDGGMVTCLDVDKIEYIDAAGDYMCIHVEGRTHIVRETMKRMVKRLDPKKFQRIHQSAIVNVQMVKELRSGDNGQYYLVMSEGTEVKMSRSYKDVVARFL